MIIDFGRKELHLSFVTGEQESITVTQGETSRVLTFKLVDKDNMVQSAVGLTLIMTISIRGQLAQTRVDGNASGVFNILLTEDMTKLSGKADYQLILAEDDKTLASGIGTMQIERNILVDDGDGVNILLNFAELKQAINVSQTIKDEVNVLMQQTISARDITDELKDETAGYKQDTLELKNETLEIKNSISNIFESENDRQLAESERQGAETPRASAELDRIEAEIVRNSAENSRLQKELLRISNEDTRILDEAERNRLELLRISNESTRISSEDTRILSENARISAETIRKNAEINRNSAEIGRAETWETWQDLIEDGILPNATTTTPGIVKLDNITNLTALSKKTFDDFETTNTTSLNNKIDKDGTKVLSDKNFTSTHETKLTDIEAGATKNTAGTNISISNGVVSATDTTYTAGTNMSLSGTVFSATNTKYTAGTNMSLSGTVFSATDTKYTAGDGISISGTIISSTVDISGKLNKSGGTMTGDLIAKTGTMGMSVRNIKIVTTEPTSITGIGNGELVLWAKPV